MNKSTSAPNPVETAIKKESPVRAARTVKLPTKNLPTNRIAVPKQIEILRAYAASHESLSRPVANNEVGQIVGMTGNTISLANAFFVSTGLLERTENGYVPSAEVKNFLHAHTWNLETPARKLSPLIRRAWFSQTLMPKLRFRPLDETEAITDLAAAAQAAPEYRPNLRMLIEYMETVGIILRDNGSIRLAVNADQSGDPADDAEPQPKPEQPKATAAGGKPDLSTSFAKANGGAVDFSINVHVNMQELSGWSADRLAAFFRGIAMVLAAKNDKEMNELKE